jgi:hypothetical protein
MTAIVVFWILCGIVGAAILSPHQKAGIGCLAGGLLGPIGIILAWIERSNLDRKADLQREEVRAAELRALASQRLPATSPEPARDERDCPFCAERILMRATVCKHCGRDVRVGVIGPSASP